MTRTIYVKTANWQEVLDNLKLQVFALANDEFYEFLNNASVDKHGKIQSNFDSIMLDALDKDDINEYKRLEKLSKVIVKQARHFGFKAPYGDVGRMHLRDLA